VGRREGREVEGKPACFRRYGWRRPGGRGGWELRRLPYGGFRMRLDGTIGYRGVVGCLAVPALDGVLDGVESGQLTGPAAGAARLENQTSNVLATHTLVGADSLHAFAATGAAEMQDVSEFAGTISAGNRFHCRQNNVEVRAVPYQYEVIFVTELAGFSVGCASGLAKVDVEVGEGAVSAHQHEVGYVKVRGVQQIKLVLQVEVEKALHGAMGCDDAGGDAGLLGLALELIQVLVLAATFGQRDRERDLAALGGRIFAARFQDSLR
jgi:hypothetical protein